MGFKFKIPKPKIVRKVLDKIPGKKKLAIDVDVKDQIEVGVRKGK